MKKLGHLIACATILWSPAHAGADTTITVTASAPFSAADVRAAVYVIDEANETRNPPLPKTTGAEIKASFETLMAELITRALASYKQQAIAAQTKNDLEALKERLKTADDAKVAAAIAAANAALD